MHLDVTNKVCTKHGMTPHVEEKNGYVRCKRCRYENLKARRHKVKDMSLEYKGGCCERCGYSKCKRALEFHHVDPKEKDFEIGSKWCNKSWVVLKKELDKCILVCSNCHREIHDEIDNL